MAHTKQQRPDNGLGFQVIVLKPLQGVPASLDSGARAEGRGGARERERRSTVLEQVGCNKREGAYRAVSKLRSRTFEQSVCGR